MNWKQKFPNCTLSFDFSQKLKKQKKEGGKKIKGKEEREEEREKGRGRKEEEGKIWKEDNFSEIVKIQMYYSAFL